jgi:hypothetical protein
MRSISILSGLILGVVIPLFSQDYRDICSPGLTFFHTPTYTLKAFRMDSIQPTGIGDTVFFSYRSLRDSSQSNNCFDTLHGSILGFKVIEYHDGRFVFFNKNDDTITIKSQAPLNGSWKFCSLPAGWIKATNTVLIADTVLGIIDSVKVISLQAMDSNNDNIPNPINQVTLKLSKDFGLTKMLDVYNIPDSTQIYTLAGKSSLSAGTQDMTWLDIFNFNVGDVFHYTGYDIGYGWGDVQWKSIQTVLQKKLSGNYDTIFYTIQSCTRTNFSTYSSTFSTDTITDTYVNGVYSFDSPEQPGLPGEFIPHYSGNDPYGAGPYATRFSANDGSFNGRLTKISDPGYYSRSTGCWRFGLFEAGAEWQYTHGLGITYSISEEVDQNGETVHQSELVYYKQGQESWGTPVGTDCSSLAGINDSKKTGDSLLQLFPNPASHLIMIYSPAKGLLGIFNLCGQQMLKQNITVPATTLDISTLPSGVYLVRLVGKEGVEVGKFIKE